MVFTDTCYPDAGPLLSVSAFQDYFISAYGPLRGSYSKDWRTHPYHSFFADDFPLMFTHADLQRSNTMVSVGPNPRVVAVIDWHQSGWYPAYGEYGKARWTARFGEEWDDKYVPMFVNRDEIYDYWIILFWLEGRGAYKVHSYSVIGTIYIPTSI
jgi:hypothetical protein